jgi:hypothetical protein
MKIGSDTAWFALIVRLSLSLSVLVAISEDHCIKQGKKIREKSCQVCTALISLETYSCVIAVLYFLKDWAKLTCRLCFDERFPGFVVADRMHPAQGPVPCHPRREVREVSCQLGPVLPTSNVFFSARSCAAPTNVFMSARSCAAHKQCFHFSSVLCCHNQCFHVSSVLCCHNQCFLGSGSVPQALLRSVSNVTI